MASVGPIRETLVPFARNAGTKMLYFLPSVNKTAHATWSCSSHLEIHRQTSIRMRTTIRRADWSDGRKLGPQRHHWATASSFTHLSSYMSQ
jgi:hypothetical protein